MLKQVEGLQEDPAVGCILFLIDASSACMMVPGASMMVLGACS